MWYVRRGSVNRIAARQRIENRESARLHDAWRRVTKLEDGATV